MGRIARGLDGLGILHGRPAAAHRPASFPEADDATIAHADAQQSRSEQVDLDGIRPMPGAHDLMAWLEPRAVPWAIVTSADIELARLGSTSPGSRYPSW